MKKNEKFLALLLSVVMILTCFVGTVTVSAEDATTPTATIVIKADDVEAGAKQIPVTFTVTSTLGINEALIKVSSNLGDIIAQPTVVADCPADIDNAGNATDYNSFFLSAKSPEGQPETVMGEIKTATISAVFVNEAGLVAGETYTVDVEIPEGKVIAASKDEVAIKLECTKYEFTVEEVAACDHANAAKEVTTQPTKDAEGVMTYTCECGETWTEAIAKPVAVSATIQHNLTLLDRVYDRFVFSVKQFSNAGYDAVNNGYFVSLEYGKYSADATKGYLYSDKSKILYDADKDVANSQGNGRSFFFNELALYEMTIDYTITVYIMDAEGVVVAYVTDTTNIAEEALNLANKKSSETKLLTCLADMMNYGQAAQDYFKKSGDHLSNAASPVEVFSKYMSYASDASILPEKLPADAAGLSKKVSTTSFNANGNVKIAASTIPTFMVIAGNYEPANTLIEVSYTNGYGRLVTDTVKVEPKKNSSGKWRYDFDFALLAMYDLSETVTVTMKYNNNVEATYEYALSGYVNDKISQAAYTNILTKMALFSRSARIQLALNPAY